MKAFSLEAPFSERLRGELRIECSKIKDLYFRATKEVQNNKSLDTEEFHKSVEDIYKVVSSLRRIDRELEAISNK